MDRVQSAKRFLLKVATPDALEAIREMPSSALETLGGAGGDAGPAPAMREAVEGVLTDRELSPSAAFALEAIIIPKERPAVDVVDGAFTVTHPLFADFSSDAAINARLRAVLPSIGRVEVAGFPGLPYGGTGFVVGRDLLMTNRHVAELFTTGLGAAGLFFRPGMGSGMDFKCERGSAVRDYVEVRRVVMIHPWWDMALLQVEGLDERHVPLKLSLEKPEALDGRRVAVVGYPAFDPRNPGDVQNSVFGGVYNVKRLQPGKLGVRRNIASFGHDVSAITHDASTLGGNSGSAVVDPDTGAIVGLHFAGLYLDANFAVPAWELSRDERAVKAGITFAEKVSGEPAPTAQWWGSTEASPAAQPSQAPTSVQQAGRSAAQSAGGATTWTIPVEITIRVGAPVPAGVSAAAAEQPAAPSSEQDSFYRNGHDGKVPATDPPAPGQPVRSVMHLG